MHDLDRLRPLIDEQLGLLTRANLLRANFTRHEITGLLHGGWLERVQGGVYRMAGSVDSFEQQELAACLVAGRAGVVTHRASCTLWEVELGSDPVVELSVPRNSSARTPDCVVHRPWRIDPRHVCEKGVFVVTTPARTIVDLGAVVPADVVANAMEQVLRRRLTSASFLRHLCDELDHPRRKGPRVLSNVLADRVCGDTPSDSDLELAMAELCAGLDIETPVFQYEVVVGAVRRRIDFAFPRLKIAIEVDGWSEHLRFGKFQDDRVRRNELELRGWMVLNFTFQQVMRDPAYVAETIIAAVVGRRAAA